MLHRWKNVAGGARDQRQASSGQLGQVDARRAPLLPSDPVLLQVVECAVVHALAQPAAAPALLSLIPGLRVHTIDVSCSGMAGTFGLRDDNYPTSLAAGRRMLLEMQRPLVLFGSTECGTCRMQMEHGSGKRTLPDFKMSF